MNLQEAREKVYNWRIHLDVPVGIKATLQLDPIDDKEIAELIQEHRKNLCGELWTDKPPEEDVFGLGEYLARVGEKQLEKLAETLGFGEFMAEAMLHESLCGDDEEDVEEPEEEDSEPMGEIDFSNYRYLPSGYKEMKDEQARVHETDPSSVIHYEPKEGYRLGFHVLGNFLYIVYDRGDMDVATLPQNIQEKICQAIEKV